MWSFLHLRKMILATIWPWEWECTEWRQGDIGEAAAGQVGCDWRRPGLEKPSEVERKVNTVSILLI